MGTPAHAAPSCCPVPSVLFVIVHNLIVNSKRLDHSKYLFLHAPPFLFPVTSAHGLISTKEPVKAEGLICLKTLVVKEEKEERSQFLLL